MKLDFKSDGIVRQVSHAYFTPPICICTCNPPNMGVSSCVGTYFVQKKKVFLSVRAIRSLTLSQYLISSPGTIHLGRLSTHIALPPTLYLERKSRSAANIIWASSPLKALGTPYQIFQGSLNPCISRSSVQRYEWAYHSAWESRQPDSTQHMQPINVHY